MGAIEKWVGAALVLSIAAAAAECRSMGSKRDVAEHEVAETLEKARLQAKGVSACSSLPTHELDGVMREAGFQNAAAFTSWKNPYALLRPG